MTDISVFDLLAMAEAKDSRLADGSGKAKSWRKAGRPRIWPFYDMEVGDQARVENPDFHQKARVSASQAARKTGAKFISRTRCDGVLVFERTE